MTAEEENTVLHFPTGHRHTLLFIAYVKHILVNVEMKAGQRLQFLEWINGQTCTSITPEMLEMIEPMSDTEMKMMHEARSLNRKDDPGGSVSFEVLTSKEVFEDFLALNPSLLAAITLHNKQWNVAPAAQQAEQQDEQRYIPPAGHDWQWAKQFNPVRVS